MTLTPEEHECSECGLPKGHKLSCVSGNEQAANYQNALERQHAATQLKEIYACDKCDLCEDHHQGLSLLNN